MSDLKKPNISPQFTIDDIHKIREWNYERRKSMTLEERRADIEQGANEFLLRLQKSKAEQQIEQQS